jgi:3-oxoacyl-[acyl-carrier protein] reductase
MSTPAIKRVAVVTGASRGIGKSIAMRLARDGRHIVLMSRSEGPLNEVKAAIEAAGGSASVVAIDIADATAFAAAITAVSDELGRVDILVNNAGITKDGLALRMSDDDWDRSSRPTSHRRSSRSGPPRGR